MKRLTKEQTKIIYISAVILVFLFIFWVFVYRPQVKKLASIKKELLYAESQISEMNRLIGDKELTEAVKDLKTGLDRIISQLPVGEEDVIDVLSQKARDLNIEVKSIIPSGRRVSGSKVPGYDIEELSVSMKISCEYQVLSDYLDILRNNLPVLVRVKKIDIRGEGEGRPILDVSMQLIAYLSKEN